MIRLTQIAEKKQHTQTHFQLQKQKIISQSETKVQMLAHKVLIFPIVVLVLLRRRRSFVRQIRVNIRHFLHIRFTQNKKDIQKCVRKILENKRQQNENCTALSIIVGLAGATGGATGADGGFSAGAAGFSFLIAGLLLLANE
jgi:hypothetical protein